MVRASRTPTGPWLCCSGHPSFADIPNIPQEQTAFFDCVFAKEGDIFKGSICHLEAMKEFLEGNLRKSAGVRILLHLGCSRFGDLPSRPSSVCCEKVRNPGRLAGSGQLAGSNHQ